MEFLRSMTLEQLTRLYAEAYSRMTRGDGYQPFGYDRRTMAITKPGWLQTLNMILDATKEKCGE